MRLGPAWIILTLVTLASVGAAAKDAVSIDINGSFEQGVGTFPSNWVADNGRPPLRLSADDAPDGENVLVYVGDASAIRSITFGFGESRELVVSASVRDTSVPVEIGVEFFRFDTSLGQQTLGPRAPSVTWENVSVHAYSPLGTNRATVLLKGTPLTLSFVDDVAIED